MSDAAPAVATKTIRHLDYELTCAAAPVDRGRFAPSLVIVKQSWPFRPRSIAVQRGDHTTAEAAIDAALKVGIEWVANYG